MFQFKHEITKNIDGFTNRHFFTIEKRIREAFIATVEFETSSGLAVRLSAMIDKVGIEEYKKTGGVSIIYFDTPIEYGAPSTFKFTIKYGAIRQHKSEQTVASSGKYEDVLKSAEEFIERLKN